MHSDFEDRYVIFKYLEYRTTGGRRKDDKAYFIWDNVEDKSVAPDLTKSQAEQVKQALGGGSCDSELRTAVRQVIYKLYEPTSAKTTGGIGAECRVCKMVVVDDEDHADYCGVKAIEVILSAEPCRCDSRGDALATAVGFYIEDLPKDDRRVNFVDLEIALQAYRKAQGGDA